jgi:hypothetical protein
VRYFVALLGLVVIYATSVVWLAALLDYFR